MDSHEEAMEKSKAVIKQMDETICSTRVLAARGKQKRARPLTAEQKLQYNRQYKHETPGAIGPITKTAMFRSPPTHFPVFIVLRPATDYQPGKYLIPDQGGCPALVPLLARIDSVVSSVMAVRESGGFGGGVGGGIGVTDKRIAALLMKVREEMVAVKEEAVAQEKVFREEMKGIEEHKKRQAEHEKFSVDFGGTLGFGIETLFHGQKVLGDSSAVPEYS